MDRNEGLEELIKENRNLKRRLRDLESTLKRNQAMLAARTAVNSMLEVEQKKIEQNMNLLLENSADIILLFDENGCFSYLTHIFLKTAGISNKMISGKHFTEIFAQLVSEEWADFIQTNFDFAMKQRSTVEVLSSVAFSENDPRDYRIRITPMINHDGKLAAAMMLLHDMTDIIRSKKQAESANLAKSRFLATVSHEMRTPISAVFGMSSIGKASADKDKMIYCFTKIEAASQHLLGVINDTLDMSKIDAGKFDLSPVEFSFEKMLQNAVNVVTFRLDEKKQKLTIHTDKAIPDILVGDGQRLAQVITNLLGNSVKFTPDEGTINLSAVLTSEENGICTIQIAVTDRGIGISPEQQARLFQPFQQADNDTSRKFGGTGLGLSISKSIVEMMGGEIRVKSELGKGSTFSFTAMLRRGGEDTSFSAALGQYEVPADINGVFAGYSILLAEDIEINREIVVELLKPTGLNIDCAENGEEAVRMFSETPEKYGLIFMDVQMPETDGYEATRLIRALNIPSAKTIPIIALTANVFREDIEKCLAASMNGHIGKPLVFDEVFRQLKLYFP